MTYQIDEIQIIPIKPKDGLVAFANCVINQCLYLSSIGIHSRLDGEGYRLTYPSKKVGERNLNIYHPINKDLSEAIERAIFQKIKKVMN